MESLTSYLRGLAALHVVAVSWFVAAFVLEPLLRMRRQKHLIVQPTRATESINGTSPGNRRVVDRIAALVHQDRLAEMTLLGLGRVLECREAFRIWRAWCPRCLSEDGDEAYDRLSWSIGCVRVCIRHRVALRDRCVCCRKRHRPLARLANPWTCPHCGTPLAGKGENSGLDAVSLAVYQLIADLASGAAPTREYVRDRFVRARDRAGGGHGLAQVLGIAESTVSALCAGSTRPHLELWAHLDAWFLTGARRRPRARRAHGCDRRTARAALENALATDPPPSLRAVAMRWGTTPATLSQRLPRLARAVVERRRRWVVEKGAARHRRVLAEVRSALEQLRRSHQPMTRRGVEAALPQAGILRDPAAREVFAAADAHAAPWAAPRPVEPNP